MKIFTHLNRKANMQKNLDEIINMIKNRIKEQNEILNEWNYNLKKFLKNTELTEDNETEFYIELGDKCENRQNMINRISEWTETLCLFKEMKCQKQKRSSKKD